MKVNTKITIPTAILTITLSLLSGFEGNALQAYYDVTGIPTICNGVTYGVKASDVLTQEECDEKTIQAVEVAYKTFAENVPANIRDKLSPKTQAAYVSFIYNVGPGSKGIKSGFVWLKNGEHSSMYNYLVAGHLKQSCDEFPKWKYANGTVYRGLERRRKMERILCLNTLNQ